MVRLGGPGGTAALAAWAQRSPRRPCMLLPAQCLPSVLRGRAGLTCSATTAGCSSLFFMWLQACSCWLMQHRKRKEEDQTSHHAGAPAAAPRSRAPAKGTAGRNSLCMLLQNSRSVMVQGLRSRAHRRHGRRGGQRIDGIRKEDCRPSS